MKYIIHHKDLLVDKSYQIAGRTASEIHPNYLKELDASQIVRFIYYLDNPDNQLVGLVNFPDYVKDKEAILGSLDILTKHLPKGYMTGTSSGYGAPTSCGDDKRQTIIVIDWSMR